MSTTSSTTSAASLFANTNWLSGKGFDVTTVVDALLEAQRGPETQWQSQQTTIANEKSALTTLQSEVSSVESTFQYLSDTSSGVFTGLTATSSNTSVVSATAGSTATAGSHVIEVSSLASTSAAYSATLSSASSTVTAGDLVIQVGSGSARTISLTSDMTLTSAASYINQQNAGVTASVLTDSSGSRLVLTSATPGSAGNITISSAPSGLGFATLAGTDANLTVDGIPVTSSSNTVQNAITGVTLDLTGTSQSAVSVNVAPDTTGITTAVASFVSAYNTVMNDLNNQFTASSSSSTSGVLQNDPAAGDLQTQLLSVMSTVTSDNSSIQTLGQLGITMNDDGTLSLNNSTLQSALTNNYSAVQSFFQDTTSSSFSETFQNLMSEMTDSVNSPIVLDLKGLAQDNTDLQTNINNLEAQLASQKTLLTSQYSTVDAELQMLPQDVNGVETLLGLNTNSSSSSR